MKNLKDYITESQNFLVNKKLKNRQNEYEYFPQDKEELRNIIINLLKQGETDLNCIDVSNITDMSSLFFSVNRKIFIDNCEVQIKYIDISRWDISNVVTMGSMFEGCQEFNSDLSNWDVSNVTNMRSMFKYCKKFDSDLSKWDISNVKVMFRMFDGCDTLKQNNKIPSWYV